MDESFDLGHYFRGLPQALEARYGQAGSQCARDDPGPRGVGYDSRLLKQLIDSLRELSLVALILHHVYPARYAIVSHHLASTLHVSGQTVAGFYIAYCRELGKWSAQTWPTPGIATVADAEMALWTWYRLAYVATDNAPEHRSRFFSDPWVQERRAERIAVSLGPVDKLDLARSYLLADPTVAAMIAWREFEVELRDVVRVEVGDRSTFPALVEKLRPEHLPPGQSKTFLKYLWKQRNKVMHEGYEVTDAAEIVREATVFLDWSRRGP